MVPFSRFVLFAAAVPLASIDERPCCEVPAVGAPAPKRVVWPPAPDSARVVYAASLSSERDIGRRSSGLARLRQLVAGTDDHVLAVQRPHDMVVDPANRVFITDGSRRQVIVFDPSARAARPIGTDGEGRLLKPMGLALDEKNYVYVADQGAKRVAVFRPNGVFVRAYGGTRALINPVDVAVDTTAGIVWVVDSYLHEVLGYRRADGVLLRRIGLHKADVADKQNRSTGHVAATHGASARAGAAGGAGPTTSADTAMRAALSHAASYSAEPRDVVENRGVGPSEFRYPSFVAVGADGSLYVCDAMNFRIQVFDRNGKFLRQIGRHGDGPGAFARPKGIALDSDGHLYVADAAFNNVQVFDAQGRVLMAFGGFGRSSGALSLPLGVFIDRYDRIYVADRYNNRVQIYEYLGGSRTGAAGRLRNARAP